MGAETHIEPGAVPGETLLSLYDRNTFFCFASPSRVLTARGPYTELNEYDGGAVAELLAALAERGLTGAAVVGAIPFDRGLRARLMLPGRLTVGAPLGAELQPPSTTRARLAVRESAEERRHFCASVEMALGEIQRGALSKVVLSRTQRVSSSPDADVAGCVRQLLRNNPGSYGFAVQLEPSHADSRGPVFFGASPELVMDKRGAFIASHPLAGSAPRSPDPDEDERRAQALLASEKDHREHAFVVEDIAARLGPVCRRLHVPQRPELVKTRTMWHLGTRIEGELLDPSQSSLELALLIHPTPAVCGAPRRQAQALIDDLERRSRGFYTGLVGWCDQRGDGEWALSIRCAQADGDGYLLYAGAGVVQGSVAEEEWLETEAKLKTMREVLRQELNREALS